MWGTHDHRGFLGAGTMAFHLNMVEAQQEKHCFSAEDQRSFKLPTGINLNSLMLLQLLFFYAMWRTDNVIYLSDIFQHEII